MNSLFYHAIREAFFDNEIVKKYASGRTKAGANESVVHVNEGALLNTVKLTYFQ